ncbi:hypothetical protein FKM82_022113 [Ascaphus truei]
MTSTNHQPPSPASQTPSPVPERTKCEVCEVCNTAYLARTHVHYHQDRISLRNKITFNCKVEQIRRLHTLDGRGHNNLRRLNRR